MGGQAITGHYAHICSYSHLPLQAKPAISNLTKTWAQDQNWDPDQDKVNAADEEKKKKRNLEGMSDIHLFTKYFLMQIKMSAIPYRLHFLTTKTKKIVILSFISFSLYDISMQTIKNTH